jgi:small subunit ribosomal protein S4
MDKMSGPRFKKCRRLGLNVVGHPKAMDRASSGTGRADKKLSSYGEQLLEKQRLRAYYGVMEKQFKNYVSKALKSDGISGDKLVEQLECRVDNMVYRAGFAASMRQARQMVSHGHMMINEKKVDRPSHTVKVGDVISLREKSKQITMYKVNFENMVSVVPYLEKDINNTQATLIKMPERNQVPIQINDHLVIEYYSKLKV